VGEGFETAADDVDAVGTVEAVGFVEVAEVSEAAPEFAGSAGSDFDPGVVSTDSSEYPSEEPEEGGRRRPGF
jgi:hypothetical protein